MNIAVGPSHGGMNHPLRILPRPGQSRPLAWGDESDGDVKAVKALA